MLYRITCPITKMRGSQTYTVEADSEDEALRKHDAGESDYENQEIDVLQHGKPEVEKVDLV